MHSSAFREAALNNSHDFSVFAIHLPAHAPVRLVDPALTPICSQLIRGTALLFPAHELGHPILGGLSR